MSSRFRGFDVNLTCAGADTPVSLKISFLPPFNYIKYWENYKEERLFIRDIFVISGHQAYLPADGFA